MSHQGIGSRGPSAEMDADAARKRNISASAVTAYIEVSWNTKGDKSACIFFLRRNRSILDRSVCAEMLAYSIQRAPAPFLDKSGGTMESQGDLPVAEAVEVEEVQ